MKQVTAFVGLGVLMLIFSSSAFASSTVAGWTTRVSVSSSGMEGNGYSNFPSISADGRFVAFMSNASNLIPRDTNNRIDIFVYDQQKNTIELISISLTGTPGNDDSVRPTISANGRYVAFQSEASDLVANDHNGFYDVFVYDRHMKVVERVSVSSDGEESNNQVMLNRTAISADGRFVAFDSMATNLVPGDSPNIQDVFVRDRLLGTTEKISVSSAGIGGNAASYDPVISADGRFVAFASAATNLTNDPPNPVCDILGVPSIKVECNDIFVRDRTLAQTMLISVRPDGGAGNGESHFPVISADGRFVAFESNAANLVPSDGNASWDIFVKDRTTGNLILGSVSGGTNPPQANQGGRFPSISANGRFIVFASDSTNLVEADTNGMRDIFLRDLTTAITTRLSVSSGGIQGNGSSGYYSSLSADGAVAAFDSDATNLVDNDSNQSTDVFVHVLYQFHLPLIQR